MSSNSHPNPFKGLRPFKQEEQEELFGRERDLLLMKDRILSSRTTLLFAGSGVGKTSFLNAKVIPALKDRYCVISHNRWTGSEEGKDAGSWNDRPPFKIWPLKAFGKWLAEALFERAWLHRRIPKTENTVHKTAKNGNAPSPSAEEIARRQVEASVQSVITQSLRSGDKKRLTEELAAFKKRPSGEAQPKPCILILDQFEEVFQYHAYEDYFRDFISDLAEIINDDSYLVRVVFSMREEFLGELSAFDNHVPDLFNNYYRLRHPEIDEARDIIQKTCVIGNVKPHLANLDKLVNDLASIEKNFDLTTKPDKGEKRSVRLVKRDFVPPPYLQIVCDSLWKEQYEKPAANVKTAKNGDAKKGTGLFLEHYQASSDKPDNEESGAQRAVRLFCETKLSTPFLKKWEQSLAARAFGFLVTKQGAKMAYELGSLASHMDERVWALKHVLHKLSEPEARILRESRGPEGSYWFELYHDMYAGVVDRWKRRFRREQRQRNVLIVSAVVVAALILPVIGLYWIKIPYDYRRTLVNYRDTLIDPDVEKDPDRFSKALVAYNQLHSTYGYKRVAVSLWAQIWQRRGQLYEAKQQRDEALMCLLQAASLAKGRAEESEYLAQANNLFAGNEQSIQATFCNDCRVSSVSPQRDLLLTTSADGTIKLWNIKERRYSSTICSRCDHAIFSTDGKNVATVSSLKDLANKSGLPGEPIDTANLALETIVRFGSQTGWTVTISAVDSGLPLLSFDVTRQRTAGGSKSDDAGIGPRLILRSFAKKDKGFLIAGIADNRLRVWRENGSEFGNVDVGSELRATGYLSSVRADFDRDARFMAAGGAALKTTLWEVTPNGLAPSQIKNLSNRRMYAFSSDGQYFLSANIKNEVGLWALPTQKQVLTPIPAPKLFSLGFGVGSGNFFVAQYDNTIQVWDSDRRQRVAEPLTITAGLSGVLLDANGKNLVISEPGVISKWSVESRRLVGELQTGDRSFGAALTPEGLFLASSDSSVRLWDVGASQEEDTLSGENEEQFFFAGISADGGLMLTVFEEGWGSGPVTFHVWNTRQKTKTVFTARAFTYATTSEPRLVAVVPEDDTRRVLIFNIDGSPKPPLSLDAEIKSISFNQSGSLLAAVTHKNEVQLIDTSNVQTTRTITSDLNISSVEFAPNGEYLVIKAATAPAGSGAAAQSLEDPFFEFESFPDIDVWSLSSFERIPLERDRSQPITLVGFGGSRLFTIQKKGLEVWDLPQRRKVREDSVADVVVAAMSEDGNLVAMGGAKSTLHFINIKSVGQASTITLGAPVEKIVFAPDGKSLVAKTESWFHNIALSPFSMRYSEGIFTSHAVAGSLRFITKTPENSQTPVPCIQWIRRGRRGWGIREASFDGKLSNQVLKGDPDLLLKDWSQRLGLQIDASGYLAPKVPKPNAGSSSGSTAVNLPG